MGVTISADGLSVIHQGSGGEAVATLPDVCLTTMGNSTVAVAYGNSAKSEDLADGSATVMVDGGQSIAIKGSSFSKSTGDAGGDKKGVTSGTIEAEAKFISASPTVKIEGKGVCRLSDQMTMNKANTMCLGGADNPSVTVSEEEVGTYSFDLRCQDSRGLPFKNAPYTVQNEKNETIFSGTTNDKGVSVVSGMPAGTVCHVVYEESADPFSIIEKRLYNPNRRDWEEEGALEEVLGSGYLVWRKKPSTGSRVWKPLDLQGVCAKVLKLHIASAAVYRSLDEENIAAHLLVLSERHQPEVYSELVVMVGMALLQDKEGSVFSLVASVKSDETKHNLLAMLRYLGTGNPEKYISQFDWDGARKRVLQSTSDILDKTMRCMARLEEHASTNGYLMDKETISQQIDSLKKIQSKLPDWFKQATDYLKERVDKILSGADEVLIVDKHAHCVETPTLCNLIKIIHPTELVLVDVVNWTNDSTKRFIFHIGPRGGKNWEDFEKYARDVMKYRNVPRENFFTEYSGAKAGGCYSQATANSLAMLDKDCRIDLPVHGETSGPTDKGMPVSAQEIARTLSGSGLKEVGVIRLDACSAGAGAFLKLLKYQLEKEGIKFGYVSAFNGLFQNSHIPLVGKRVVTKMPLKADILGDSRPVMKGSLDIAFPGTRYK